MVLNKQNVGLQLGATMKIVGKHIHKAFTESGENATMEQFFILLLLNNSTENLTQQDISVIMHKDKSAVLRQTDELEKKKLVVRIPDDVDRRKKILTLTKKGVETVNRLLEIEGKVFEKFLKDVSIDELTTLATVLNKIRMSAQD